MIASVFVISCFITVLEIAVDVRASFSRKVGIFQVITLAILFIVRTNSRVVEANLNTGVVIPTDICASARLLIARTVQIALAVPVVRAAELGFIVIAELTHDHSSRVLAKI